MTVSLRARQVERLAALCPVCSSASVLLSVVSASSSFFLELLISKILCPLRLVFLLQLILVEAYCDRVGIWLTLLLLRSSQEVVLAF